ncbi:MAG: glycosyltransferase [Lishizhenia sp.]
MTQSKKKKIFFLAPYPQGKAPSQRFRFEQYLSYFKKQGFEYEVHSFLTEKGWNTIYKRGNFISKLFAVLYAFHRRIFLLFQLKKADYIFIHREASHVGPPIFEWIITKVLKRKFVYDFDDAIWLPNYSKQNAKFQRLKNYKKVNKIMRWADKITAGNAHLAEYAKQYNQNVSVLPTTIDTENVHNLKTNQNNLPLVIGWTGSHTTAQYLDTLVPVLKKLEKEFVFEFRVISNENPKLDLASFRFIEWNKATEIEDLAAINIGVMPLEDDIWAKGKCGFKALQYMALEIPCVISPVGVNTSIIIDSVNGYLAQNPKDWYLKLATLLKNKELRNSIGKEGRKTLIENYSVLANKEKYLGLFKE